LTADSGVFVIFVFQITDATLGLFALHCPRLSVLVSKLISSLYLLMSKSKPDDEYINEYCIIVIRNIISFMQTLRLQ